jgi:uncharacterized protein
MAISWDQSKRLENLRAHKYDFQDAWKIFNGLEFTFEDDRFAYPERRYNTIGFVDGRIAKLTYCQESENLRVISFRKATKREARQYYIVLRERDGLGGN